MNPNSIISLKKIVSDKYDAGIYAITPNNSFMLLDVNNRIVASISLQQKMDIFKIVTDCMIDNNIDNYIFNVGVLFDYTLEPKNKELEKSINILYKKVLRIFLKPNIDKSEILSISKLVSTELKNGNMNNNVKEELQKKLYYI